MNILYCFFAYLFVFDFVFLFCLSVFFVFFFYLLYFVLFCLFGQVCSLFPITNFPANRHNNLLSRPAHHRWLLGASSFMVGGWRR